MLDRTFLGQRDNTRFVHFEREDHVAFFIAPFNQAVHASVQADGAVGQRGTQATVCTFREFQPITHAVFDACGLVTFTNDLHLAAVCTKSDLEGQAFFRARTIVVAVNHSTAQVATCQTTIGGFKLGFVLLIGCDGWDVVTKHNPPTQIKAVCSIVQVSVCGGGYHTDSTSAQ
ncbi:MAG: hypothetical protein IPN53_03935 [Comamonadaceae bacterium]|nr:hypothetical protein [Comamonadaceae bacterium]